MSLTRLLQGLTAGGLLLALLLGRAGQTVADTSTPADVITVTGADATRDVSPAQSNTLNTHLSTVGARPQVQFGEGLRYNALAPVSGTLQTLVNSVGARPAVQFGEGLRYLTLPASLPSALQAVAGAVGAHVHLQFAESNRALTLGYPSAIITDTAPPQITQVGATPGGAQTTLIQWTTDEFATSTVLLGSASGNYTQTVEIWLFAKTHAVAVSGLTEGNTYFYKVRSIDRDGNLAESGEASFVAVSIQYLYLPSIRR